MTERHIFSLGLEGAPEAAEIRKKIFVEEQGFAVEFDEIDSIAHHLVIYLDEQAVAAGRVFEENGAAHIGRVCVLPEFRGCGVGTRVVELLEEKARELGFKTVSLSAQVRAQKFYQNLGYTAFGGVFLDEFCPHCMMKKSL